MQLPAYVSPAAWHCQLGRCRYNFQQPLRTIWQPRSLILPAEGCRLKCSLPVLHDLQYFVKHRPGGLILAHKRELLRPVRGNERDYICVRAKAGTLCAQVIGHNHIQIFFPQLCPGIFQQVFGFHGKSAQKLPVFSGRHAA